MASRNNYLFNNFADINEENMIFIALRALNVVIIVNISPAESLMRFENISDCSLVPQTI